MTRALRRAPALALLVACTGPGPDFDGRYRVESHTLNEASCAAPGDEIERAYSTFEIRERSFGGVTIYPVYPCDESGACAEDNDSGWSLVVVEGDLDQVSATYAASGVDSCVLGSVDLVIHAGPDGGVVLENRTLELVIEPYDANTCTTGNAKLRRGAMECVAMQQLVGSPTAEAM